MSEDDLKRIFARNLKRMLDMSGKQPVDLVNDLKIPFSTVSNWLSGQKFPRAAKLQMLADYLNIKVSDLTNTDEAVPESYYLNDDARELAEFLFNNPDYKVLFDASRNVKREDIQFIKEMMDRFNGGGRDC